jgi:hypothetical protein
MIDMTDEEYDALDELVTRTTPEFTDIPGVFAQQRSLLDSLDVVAKNYIQTRAEATHKPPAQIIGELVREKIAAQAST